MRAAIAAIVFAGSAEGPQVPRPTRTRRVAILGARAADLRAYPRWGAKTPGRSGSRPAPASRTAMLLGRPLSGP